MEPLKRHFQCCTTNSIQRQFDLLVNCFNSQEPFFDHKLCFKFLHGEFNLVLNIYFLRLFKWFKGGTSQKLGNLEIPIHKLIIIWECLGFTTLCCLAFSHICENVFEFQDIVLPCFPSHALVLVMTPMLRSYLVSYLANSIWKHLISFILRRIFLLSILGMGYALKLRSQHSPSFKNKYIITHWCYGTLFEVPWIIHL